MVKIRVFKFIVGIILICQSTLYLCGCENNTTNASTTNTKANIDVKFNKIPSYGLIYENNKEINYKIYSSEIIDTYIIATAVYNDFKCQNIMPNLETHDLYVKTKEYFSPYKNHEFIKKLGKYTLSGDINCDIALMLNDSFNSASKTKEELKDIYDRGIFTSEEEINEFLRLFKSFYSDTKADKFFKENSKTYLTMNEYIKNNIENTNVINIIKETEKYVGNKNKYFSGKEVKYETFVTLYRPFMAMFNKIDCGNTIRIISFQSPNDFSRNPEKFDVNQMVSSTAHEFIHNFINIPVQNNNSLINELAVNKEKQNFVSPMYQSMPWNRVVDENFVRVVQGRIYKNVFNEERAISEVLDKEIRFGGFSKLMPVYYKLEEYENKRDTYVMIDDFMPKIIRELFK